jgi:RES domain-containing protein
LILFRVSNFVDLTGKGGELANGRWHTRQHGRRIVYLSDHPALCLLEMIVHVSREEEMPDTYQLLSLDLSDNLIEQVEPGLLSEDWRSDPTVTQRIGNSWLLDGKSAGLLVPSVIVPVANNCLINPLVPAVATLRPKVVGRFPFDTRLRRKDNAAGQ